VTPGLEMLATTSNKRLKAMILAGLIVGQVFAFAQSAPAQSAKSQAADHGESRRAEDDPHKVLSQEEWKRVDRASERALTWLAGQQRDDGSFPTFQTGQPAVTSLCVMAFLAHGHLPSDGGPYGQRLERALEYVLDSQKESGLIARMAPEGESIDRNVNQEVGVTTAYNHAISSLTLSELYGIGGKSNRIQHAVDHALTATLQMQKWPKSQAEDKGGWRYVNKFDHWDSDVSLTGWELMFLRSARNAGFEVPKQPIDDAVAYIRRAYSKKYATVTYTIAPFDTRSRAMAGAGILALAHGGMHDTEEARRAGEWLLRQKFEPYNRVEPFEQTGWHHDRYHYAVFFACQGMYQIGGRYWIEFFPRIVLALLKNQRSDGSWPAESHPNDARYGNAYTTALMVLSLGSPNQLLPIFQR
jgi:hypothetical protein